MGTKTDMDTEDSHRNGWVWFCEGLQEEAYVSFFGIRAVH